MTNAEIIFAESQKLAENGIIKYTGRIYKVVGPDGLETEVRETEPIHTYNAWKEMGLQVQKGEKAVAQFVIRKHKNGKVDEETGVEEKGKMFMKKASFFTAAQVAPIAEKL